MTGLVTRFHVLLLSATVAITAVAYLHIPESFAFVAHWSGGTADWQWPRNWALPVAPGLQISLLAAFFSLERMFSRNHLAKTQHIFVPILTVLLGTIAAVQLSLLVLGIGSDLDLLRLVTLAEGAGLLVLGIVLREAERHTYAGMRLPWPIASDRHWRISHQVLGVGYAVGGLALIALAWINPGLGLLIIALTVALLVPPTLAGITSTALALFRWQ